MKNKALFFISLFSLISYAQNQQMLKDNDAFDLYKKGDLIKSFELLNKINDKKILENTTVKLYIKNIETIFNHQFFNKIKLNDSLYKIYIKSNVLKSQGVFNTKTSQYTILPIYDSINVDPNYYQKFLQVYKNNLTSLMNCETGKTIIPFGNYTISFDNKYIYTNTKGKYDNFTENGLTNLYDINGNLLLKDLNTFSFITSRFYSTKDKNNQYKIIDFDNKKTIIDVIDYYTIPANSIVENDILYENNWISFSKNNKLYLYKITKDTIEDTNKFDTYVYLPSNYNYFDSTLTTIINQKESAINNNPNKCCWSHYTIVKKENKYGIFNVSKDRYYKEPIYDSINGIGNTFFNGKWINLIYNEEIFAPKTKDFKAFIFKRNNLLGLLNFKGEIIANAKYDEIQQGYNDVYYLRKGAKWGFIGTNKGDSLVPVNFDFITGENGNLIGFKNKKQTCFSSNGIKLKPKVIEKSQMNKVYVYDNDNYFDSEKIETNRQIYKKKNQFGLDDLNHNEIIPPTYTEIKAISKDRFLVALDSLTGVIDENGKTIIPNKYFQIQKLYNSNVLDVTNKKELHAIYSFDGKELYPFTLEPISDSKILNSTTSYYLVKEVSDTLNYKYDNYSSNPKILLKVENNTVEKVNINGEFKEFSILNYLIFGDINGKGFYNLENQKYITQKFSKYIDEYQNKRIFAQKGTYFDTLIDELGNETILEHPFFKAINGFYFFKQNDRIGVINKDLKVANFNYPILKNLVEYNTYSNTYSNEYRQIASSLFKFNPDSKSKKDGIINFDGTVLFEPNRYDEISFINFDNTYFQSFKYNPSYKKFCNNLFIASIEKKESHLINLITYNKETIATFEIKKGESWNFCVYNDGLLIKSHDSIKQYNFKNKKIDFKIKATDIEENSDGGYTIITNLDSKFFKINMKKISNSGLFILDTIVERDKKHLCNLNIENYIQKKETKYGTINSKEKQGIPFIYESLESKNGKLFIAKKDNLYSVVDAENQIIIDKKYQDIKWKDFKNPYSNYTNPILIELFAVKENNKWGLIDFNTKTILPTNFDTVEVQYDNIIAKKDSLVSVYDYNGILKFSVAIDSIKSNATNNYTFFKKGKEVFRDQNGTIVDKNPYISWEDELKLKYCKQIGSKFYISKKDTIIDKNPIISIKDVEATKDSFLDEIDYLLIQNENNLKGLYTTNLEKILPFDYDEIIVVKNLDYLIAKKNDKYGVVDKNNKIAIPFEYDEIQYYKGLFECKIKNRIINKTPQNKTIYNIKKRVQPIIVPD